MALQSFPKTTARFLQSLEARHAVSNGFLPAEQPEHEDRKTIEGESGGRGGVGESRREGRGEGGGWGMRREVRGGHEDYRGFEGESWGRGGEGGRGGEEKGVGGGGQRDGQGWARFCWVRCEMCGLVFVAPVAAGGRGAWVASCTAFVHLILLVSQVSQTTTCSQVQLHAVCSVTPAVCCHSNALW